MATSGINSSMFTVGTDGKLNVGGIASGIDSKAIIDALMMAKRQPAVQIEAKITANATKISALSDFKGKMASVVSSLDALRAAPGSSTNVFNSKAVSGTTSATSGTPSGVDSLLIASVGADAQNMTHTIKVQQLATAHQVRSDAFGSTSNTLVSQGVTAGDMTLGGKTITVSSTDTLLDLRAKINNAGAGVTATIVSSDSSHHYLVLTSNATGEANAMTFGGAGVTDTLGLTENAGVDIKNELAEANNAIIDVDGIEGIERSTNSINDVLSGVTLSLLKAEPGTTITLKVEPDLTAIKGAVYDFVDAYNAVRSYVSEQRTAADRNDDGTVGDNEYGPLAYDQLLRDAMSQLSSLVAGSVDGAADGFASLGQVGIVMKADYTLAVDNTVLDGKLLTNVDGMKQLFSFGSSVSDSRVTVLTRGAATESGNYTLNITGTDADGNVTGATWNGVAMSITNGKTLTAADGTRIYFNSAPNLGAINGINVSMSRGLADQFYDSFNNLTKVGTGTIDTQVTQLQLQNTDYKDRVDVLDGRLAVTRIALEAKYTAMEIALSKLQTLQQTIEGYTKSLNQE